MASDPMINFHITKREISHYVSGSDATEYTTSPMKYSGKKENARKKTKPLLLSTLWEESHIFLKHMVTTRQNKAKKLLPFATGHLVSVA